MKKILLALACVIFAGGILFALNSKNNKTAENNNTQATKQTAQRSGDMSKKLVAYFSASGVTKRVANNLAQAAGADIFEIKPVKPYTNADLDWTDANSRSSVEMKKDKSIRPEFVKGNLSIDQYDVIFVGFPIWWYIAPTIINTFLESYDFSNKKIILFATSGGSGFGKTVENLKPSVSGTTEIVEGRILNRNPGVDELKKWVASLNI